LQLGKQGLTPNLVASVKEVFNTNELIKIKFLDFQDEKHELAEQLAEQSGSDLVAVIGNIAILYRVHSDPERRSIVLPD
jgi:RNA-binding protein